MATRVTTTLVDDTDGSDAAETVSFSIDSVAYELDLSEANAVKLRDAMAPWVAAARKTGGRRVTGRKVSTEVDNHAVRVWAASNGIELSKRGRIPAGVVAQYREAGN